jgi:hypothetical protein
LTCIDRITNLVELTRIDNKTAAHVAMKTENTWMARYPRPQRCVHDKGGEFMGYEFQRMLQQNGIQDVPTTSRNPQANAVCEQMHQTVGNVLRTLLKTNPPGNIHAAEELIDTALATAMYATRCAVSRSLGISPGAMVFHRDMFLDIPVIADLLTIQAKRQVLIDENLRRANMKRRPYDYAVGDFVMVKEVDPNKMDEKAIGPFPIVKVHANGNLTIQPQPHVTERPNIRHVVPYHQQLQRQQRGYGV